MNSNTGLHACMDESWGTRGERKFSARRLVGGHSDQLALLAPQLYRSRNTRVILLYIILGHALQLGEYVQAALLESCVNACAYAPICTHADADWRWLCVCTYYRLDEQQNARSEGTCGAAGLNLVCAHSATVVHNGVAPFAPPAGSPEVDQYRPCFGVRTGCWY